MSYEAKVFRVLIASPSDVEEERELVTQVIQAWNDLHSANRKVVLLPLRWETHSAPEYGVRPQETINRAVVNDCDLLVGIFWTRIGSPTGEADSGTLEEIDRVGKAGKPVMLYFSRVPTDPDGLDLKQVEKLKEFKLNTYPKGLVETYKTRAEFREKINRQLEMKVRDLQEGERTGKSPLTFNLVSNETGKPVGSKLTATIYKRDVIDLNDVPYENREAVEGLVKKRMALDMMLPVIMGFGNSGTVAIRNLFADISIKATYEGARLSDNSGLSRGLHRYLRNSTLWESSDSSRNVDSIFAAYESEGFRVLDGEWRLSAQWPAIQPQRYQLAKPALFLTTDKSTKLHLEAKIYSDSLAAPSEFRAELDVHVEHQEVKLDEIIPDWAERIKSAEKIQVPSEWLMPLIT